MYQKTCLKRGKKKDVVEYEISTTTSLTTGTTDTCERSRKKHIRQSTN
jgi:hypothetical protein